MIRLLALSFVIYFFHQFSFAHDMHFESSAQTILKTLVKKIDSAGSQQEYEFLSNEDNWTELLANKISPSNQKEFCQALRSLHISDIALFESILVPSSPIAKKIGCSEDILHSYQEFLKGSQAQLLQQYTNIPGSQPGDTLGPSEERILSVDPGPSLPADDPLPKGTFAFTFDDGPHPTRTRQLLEILEAEKIHATFFMLGKNVDHRHEIAREVAAHGHTIGGHTYNHPDLSRYSFDNAVEEIERGFLSVTRAVGFVDPFFRFPYGARTRSLRNWISNENIADFFWSIDTLDWKKRNPSQLLPYALEQTDKAGRGIILFHDIHPQTIAVMPAFLRALDARGYKIVVYRTVSESKSH